MIDENKLLQSEKNRFLVNEFFMLSWEAAVQQRNKGINLFCDKIDSEKKYNFRNELKQFIIEILSQYENKVDSAKHFENIKAVQGFCVKYADEYKDLFPENSIIKNFSTAQKLLNMMCKYYWCMNWISEPPDLPIDRINISKLVKKFPDEKQFSWTQDLNEENYPEKIREFNEVAKEDCFPSVAVWELFNWKRDAYTGDEN